MLLISFTYIVLFSVVVFMFRFTSWWHTWRCNWWC